MHPRRPAFAVALLLLTATVMGAGTSASAGGNRTLLVRGGRVSSVARPEASRVGATVPDGGRRSCTIPGGGNYGADCNSHGNPVNETTIATNGSSWVAGANDYNSYNNHAQLGYYASANGKTWIDNGPLDLFPHDVDNGAGDPGVAVDAD